MKILPLLAAFLIAGTAWAHDDFGRPGDPKKATRTVRIGMADTMRYTPSELKVRPGETVKFVVHNNGKVDHEMVLGTMQALKEHAEMMKRHPGMHHDDSHSVDVAPGKFAILVWQFTKAGTFHFGCFEPGHFEAGMVGKIEVTGSLQ
jgi:uncharacterized cupredoxin-like copper-binding protein